MSISRAPVRPARKPLPRIRSLCHARHSTRRCSGIRTAVRGGDSFPALPAFNSSFGSRGVGWSTFAPFALGITGLGQVTRSGPVPYRFMMADPIGGNAGLDDFTTDEALPAGQGLAVGHFPGILQANRAHQALAAWAGH